MNNEATVDDQNKEKERETDRERERQTERETDRERQTERETERERDNEFQLIIKQEFDTSSRNTLECSNFKQRRQK